MSFYSNVIVTLTKCAPEEAPLVEGLLRAVYGTLDGLNRATFRREAKKALRDARKDPRLAEDVARSYGLIRQERRLP